MYYQQPMYQQQPQQYYQPNQYDQNQQMALQQDINVWSNAQHQPQQIQSQQIYIQPMQPMSEQIYAPPPVLMEPVMFQSPQPSVHIQDIKRSDYCTQDLQIWSKSRLSAEIYCKVCKRQIDTKLSYEIGTGTFLMMCFLLPTVVGFCIPLCFDSMKNVKHKCPQCGSKCGYKKYLC